MKLSKCLLGVAHAAETVGDGIVTGTKVKQAQIIMPAGSKLTRGSFSKISKDFLSEIFTFRKMQS